MGKHPELTHDYCYWLITGLEDKKRVLILAKTCRLCGKRMDANSIRLDWSVCPGVKRRAA